jgi:D-aminopeptidase
VYIYIILLPRELAELQKANAVTQSVAQEAALTAEQSAREELKGILDQQKLGAQREMEALLMQVSVSIPLNVHVHTYPRKYKCQFIPVVEEITFGGGMVYLYIYVSELLS